MLEKRLKYLPLRSGKATGAVKLDRAAQQSLREKQSVHPKHRQHWKKTREHVGPTRIRYGTEYDNNKKTG